MTKPSILCRLGYHAWGAPKQGEMSAEARDVLTAAARHFPPGTVFRELRAQLNGSTPDPSPRDEGAASK